MRKQFSHALIIILILICPLSYSTDTVPDFKPACDISSIQLEKTAVNVSQHSSEPAPSHDYRTPDTPQYLPTPATSPIVRITLTSRGRSP